MSIDILKGELKAGVLRRLYLFYGPEEFLVRHYAGELEKAAVPEGARPFCVTVFDGRPAPGKVADACHVFPLVGDRNFVVVKNAGLLKPAPSGKAGEARQKPAAKRAPGADDGYEELVASVPAHACLLVIEDEVDRRMRLFTQMSKHGLAVEFARQKADELAKWAAMVASRHGMRFEGAALRRFMERAGDSMTEIRSELDKLVAYAKGPAAPAAPASPAGGPAARASISERDVDAVCSFPPRARIFDLMDSVADGDRLKAAATLDTLFATGEPAPKISAMLSRHLILLRQAKRLRDRGLSLGAATEAMKMNPYRARILWRQCAGFRASALDGAIQSCYEFDMAAKTGALGANLALEMLVASIQAVIPPPRLRRQPTP